MTKQEAATILAFLESFKKIEHPATDEVGFVALKLSCSLVEADEKIQQARWMLKAEAK